MSLQADIQNINWQRQANTLFKVLLDMKVLGLIVFMGFTCYGIGWDTVLRPNLEEWNRKDTAIADLKKTLDEKQALFNKYDSLEKDLQNLDTVMDAVPPTDQPNLVALGVSESLLKTLHGELRDQLKIPPLPPPHNIRKDAGISAVSTPSEVDLLNPTGATAAAPQANQTGSRPGGEEQAMSASLPVQRYDFDLKVSGTYPALLDVLNELTLRKHLVRLNKITITKPVDPNEPDARDPGANDYPLMLDMTVNLSVYLYTANAQP